RYAAPGALPSVEAAPLADDLLRRDFTINAMAVALSPGAFGRLVDLVGAQRDLDRRRLAPLPPLSVRGVPPAHFPPPRHGARAGLRAGRAGSARAPAGARWARVSSSLGHAPPRRGGAGAARARRLARPRPAAGLGRLSPLGLWRAGRGAGPRAPAGGAPAPRLA